MKPIRSMQWVVCGLAMALAAAGCASDSTSETSGSLNLSLELAEGVTINEVSWEITGGDMDAMSGTIDTSAPGATASVEVFGLLPGDDYTVTLEATDTTGTVSCKGDADFAVEVGVATDVMVFLNCKLPSQLGGVRVNGKFNICAELAKVVVSPLQTSVGNDIDLSAEGQDAEGDAIEYAWSATGGTVADPSAQVTTYTCEEAGDQTITIQVSDDGFDYCTHEWTVAVTCVAGEVECTEDADCDEGEVCVDSMCVVDLECTEDADCDEGEICVDNECVVDLECTEDADCDEGEVCVDNECVVEVGCTEDADCDEGEICVNNMCVIALECTEDADCDEGEICVDNMCVVDLECTEDADCDEGEVCVDNMCVVDLECTEDADCDEGEACVDNECVAVVDPCEGVDCNDNNDCTADSCVDGDCINEPVEDGAMCACPTCGAEGVCMSGMCVEITGPTIAAGQGMTTWEAQTGQGNDPDGCQVFVTTINNDIFLDVTITAGAISDGENNIAIGYNVTATNPLLPVLGNAAEYGNIQLFTVVNNASLANDGGISPATVVSEAEPTAAGQLIGAFLDGSTLIFSTPDEIVEVLEEFEPVAGATSVGVNWDGSFILDLTLGGMPLVTVDESVCTFNVEGDDITFDVN
jgi:hypothetical protein